MATKTMTMKEHMEMMARRKNKEKTSNRGETESKIQ